MPEEEEEIVELIPAPTDEREGGLDLYDSDTEKTLRRATVLLLCCVSEGAKACETGSQAAVRGTHFSSTPQKAPKAPPKEQPPKAQKMKQAAAAVAVCFLRQLIEST